MEAGNRVMANAGNRIEEPANAVYSGAEPANAGLDPRTDPASAGPDPRTDPALRSRLRKILAGIVLLCLVLGAAGWAFVRWMATLPPGTIKAP